MEWNYPGSKWWKVDFHAHTPKSDDYGRGDESLKITTTPEVWLQSAMSAGLDCIVVADHNSGSWIEPLRDIYTKLEKQNERPEWFRPLTIFPGVEITVSTTTGRIHLLAVFDPHAANGDNITAVLGRCGITKGFGDEKETSTSRSFEDVLTAIEESNGIAIPAHIDGNQGLLHGVTTINPELNRCLARVFAAEFCDPHAFDDADFGIKKAVERLAVVGGSDAHKPEHIGEHTSWIKMSRPSLEGLRLALIDREFCVRNQAENPNREPDIFLRSLQITGMWHCGRVPGRPFHLELHPRFNAIIGGRGTGKSTALETIRIVARRERELDETPKLKDDLEKFMKLASGKGVMMPDTELLFGIQRRGKEFRLRWRFDGEGHALEELTGEVWEPCDAGDLRERFPMSIYSQKQINELASNPKGLIEILDRSPQVDRAVWQGRWNSAKSQFLQLRERQREITRQLAQESQIKAKLGDVENDLKQYEEKGHGEILKRYQQRTQQLRALPPEDDFDGLAEEIRKVAETASAVDFPEHLFVEDDSTAVEARAIHAETATALSSIQQELLELASKVDRLSVSRKEKVEASQWYQAVQQSVQDYQALVNEYEQKDSHLDLSVYGQWVQQRNQFQQEVTRMEGLRKEAEVTQNQINEVYQELYELRDDLLKQRKAFISSVIGTNPYVRMELVPFGDTSTIDSDYRSLLGLDDTSFRTSILDRENRQGLLWDLSNWDDAGTSEAELPNLLHKLKQLSTTLSSGNTAGVPSYIHGSFTNRVQRNCEQQPANLDQLWCWWPEDLLRVKYVRDPQSRKFEDLEKGSAGQKASAILAFLLSHGNEPLIIDQPEDDLDNTLIYDLVVRQIHENKNRRQLIIVTHNPNIVVNGDAELVHVLKFEAGQVRLAVQGGLEEGRIRDQICQIMEGGREAFEKRYRRITLEV